MGYYDTQKGYYVGDSGQSDSDRTTEAIQYYEKNGMSDQAKSAVNYAKSKGYTEANNSPAKTISSNSAKSSSSGDSNIAKQTKLKNAISSRNVQSGMAETPSSYYVPYEQALRDSISAYPSYTAKTEQELLSEANTTANLQVDPQKTALQQSLTNAIAAAAKNKEKINANYATVGETANSLLADAEKSALISANARGGGRSGAVEYMTGELKAPIMTQVAQAEAQKAADLTGVDTGLDTIQTTYDQSVTALEAQRGSLVAQKLAALKELEYAKQVGNWEAINAATASLAALTTQQNQFDNSLLQNQIETMGVTPSYNTDDLTNSANSSSTTSNTSGTSALTSPVGLRAYAEGKGAKVGYNAASGEVSVNGNKYTPTQLISAGAQLVDGRWLIPESVIAQML